MCGIIGYTGNKDACAILLEGLKRLEYRGYDSAGIALISKKGIQLSRREGKIKELECALSKSPLSGRIGIGHTRWATHGKPSERNAHPHHSGKVAVVHNGIIENYLELKKSLEKKGRKFLSETDSEVIAQFLDQELKEGQSPESAIQKALEKLQGSFAVVFIIEDEPETIFAFKRQSPLILGLGQAENLIASDIPALLSHTRNIIPLEDDEYAMLTAHSIEIRGSSGEKVSREPSYVSWTPAMAEKAGFKHFMLKEIFEQPDALSDTLMGRIQIEQARVKFDELSEKISEFLPDVSRIQISACGTAYHASLVARYWIEKLARIPCATEIASEFRYREPLVDNKTLAVFVSQSGETADTLAAEAEARRLGAKTLAVCNVVGSTLSRKADGVIYTRAGPEIGVASTKAFITQLALLYLFALYLAQIKNVIAKSERSKMLAELLRVPSLIGKTLEMDPAIEEIARKYYQSRIFFYIARGLNSAIALEGALKLKEISYIHAEGYPAGELKHGPIALIDKNATIVALIPNNRLFQKTYSNLEEVSSREGRVIAVGNPEQESLLRRKSQDLIIVPDVPEDLEPMILTPPLQLLAYHIALFNGTDVDQPRNLAKSVTVE